MKQNNIYYAYKVCIGYYHPTVRCNRSGVTSASTLTLFSIHDAHLPNLFLHCPLLLIFTFIFLLTQRWCLYVLCIIKVYYDSYIW